MNAALLATKLHIPAARQNLVSRPRLTARLNDCLAYPLTLISAPAGYGKTSLVSEWHAGAGGSIPMAWLSLDADDNDPARFLTYLIAALDSAQPGRCQAALALLQSPQPPPVPSILTVLLNELGTAEEPFVLVLDDYHFVTSQPVHDTLTFVVEHQPPPMRIILLTRADPPLPLARLRARNQLADIRAEQLRFTREEVALFLNGVMGLALSGDDIAAMEARTEGWIAGLQLAALSMQGCQDIPGFVSAFAGSHSYIMDYLVEEVLKLQPEPARSFLLRTSILDRLCGPLCDAVLQAGAGEPADGQAMLEALEQKNLFLVPLDDERRWYRYHHLFADVLNRRLERVYPGQLAELRRRASVWYERNGLFPEAIQQALQAGDRERAALLVEEHGCDLLMRGEVVTLLKWVEAVESHPLAGPWTAIQKVWSLLLVGRLAEVEGAFQTADQRISRLPPGPEVQTLLGAVATGRAHRANLQGDTALAESFARQALAHLGDSDSFSCSLKSAATLILGDASRINGNLEQAKRAYTEAVSIGRAAGDAQMVIMGHTDLAGVLMEQGQLYQAARTYAEALQLAARPDGPALPLAESVYFGLSRVSYKWNDLEAAAEHARQCIRLGEHWGDKDVQALAAVMVARVEQARGNPDKAKEAMRAVEQLAGESSLPPLSSIWVESCLARLWIAQGDLARAVQLVQRSGISAADDIPYRREPEYLVLARVRLAGGDHDGALALLARMLGLAEAGGRMGQAVEILVLQALAFQAKRDSAQALSSLARALALAQPEGYVRVFLDEGEPMARLLVQAQAHHIGYAAELLAAMGPPPAVGRGEQPPAQPLIEPLSAREIEVLKLIEAGCSNQEIAARLVISLPTVKRHISNIYAKLGVKSRTQAIAMGRELKLV